MPIGFALYIARFQLESNKIRIWDPIMPPSLCAIYRDDNELLHLVRVSVLVLQPVAP